MIADHVNTAVPAPAARFDPPGLRAGDRGRLVVTLDIPPGVHIQSHDPGEPFLIPTTLQLDPAPGVTFGPVEYPTPHTQRFDWTPVQLDVHRGPIAIVVPFTTEPSHDGGRVTLTGRLRYQACTDSLCLPPVQDQLEAILDIEPVSSQPGPAGAARDATG